MAKIVLKYRVKLDNVHLLTALGKPQISSSTSDKASKREREGVGGKGWVASGGTFFSASLS